MDAAMRMLVRRRAKDCCEYCGLPESSQEVTFHVEHIIAQQHGGSDDSENLALACDRCNFYKGPNLSAIDPETNQIVRLLDPRRDRWDEHFQRQGIYVHGQTAIGRATLNLLRMNAPARLELWKQIEASRRQGK